MSNGSIVGGVKSLTIANGSAAARTYDVDAASVMPGGTKKEAIETATSVVFKTSVAKAQIKATVKTRKAVSVRELQSWDQVSATLVSSNGRVYRITGEGCVVDALEVDVVEGSVEITIEADPQNYEEVTVS